jgi:alpha-beta hydrolase superfamily lysophospholipase
VTLLGRARNGPSPDAIYIMSTPERFRFKSDDGLSIACVKWENGRHIRGVIQIAHGLGEHIGRF